MLNKKLYTDFTEKLNHWIYVEKKEHYYMYPVNYDYQIDSCVFISTDSSNAIILITLTNKTAQPKSIGGGDVKLIYCKFNGIGWDFLEKGRPNFVYGLSDKRDIPYTHAELAKLTITQLMEDGLVNKWKPCVALDSYINKKWRD